MGFQKTVLIIALIILSFMLFFIALAMKGLNKSQKFPPEIAECPDYWIRSGNVCVPGPSKHNCGLCRSTNEADSKCKEFTGEKNKKQWAQDCQVEWDGLEYLED